LFLLRFHVLDHEDFDEIENLYGLEWWEKVLEHSEMKVFLMFLFGFCEFFLFFPIFSFLHWKNDFNEEENGFCDL
jgi:hypothetical protein